MIDLHQICRALEKKSCIIHNERPKATVAGNTILLTCCCKDFESQLDKVIEEETNRQIDNKIDDLFDDF